MHVNKPERNMDPITIGPERLTDKDLDQLEAIKERISDTSNILKDNFNKMTSKIEVRDVKELDSEIEAFNQKVPQQESFLKRIGNFFSNLFTRR